MKTLKKSILLLASLVVAVSAASCINDELTEPQKEMAVKELATVDEQAASMEATLADLEALLTSAEGLDDELASVVSSIENHIADLKAGATLLDGTLATLERQKELAEVMAAIEFGAEATKGGAALTKAVASVDKRAESWLGKHFAAYYPAAKAEASAAARLAALDLKTQKISVEAILSDVEAGLRKNADKEELTALAAKIESNADEVAELLAALTETRTEVETEYAETVETAVTDPSGFDLPALKQFNSAVAGTLAEADNSLAGLISRVEACVEQLEDIKTRLGELESTVADLNELLGLIQSVTFMSEYSAENAIAYYTLGSESREDGKKVRNPQGTIDLRYVIRPARAAQALTASDLWDDEVKVFGYYANTITKAAPETFNFDITKVTADGAGNGIVTVTVSAASLNESFYFKETGAKLALSIATGKTDLTSKFVEIVPKDQSGTINLESISLEKDEVEFDEGDELNLKAILNPSNVTVKELTWTTDNSGIVSVSGSGRIKGEGVGQATITVTSKGTDEWGRTLSASCTVKVNPAIKLSGPSYVEEGKTADLTLDFPSSMLIESKVWYTSDDKKVTVSDGVISGVANTYSEYTYEYSPVTVYCKINDNITLSHEVKVVVPQPRQVKFNNYADDAQEVTMKLDQSISLAGTILPAETASNFRLFYESTAGFVGWINSSTGVINEYRNTLSPGVVTVTAKVFENGDNHYFAPGRGLSRSMMIHVEPYWVQTITLDDLDLEPGASVVLNPKFTSDVPGVQPTNTEVEYSSSNTSIATVDANGTLKALSAGDVTITARSKQNSSIYGTCTVRVTAPWKDFEVGQYILNNNGEIEFASTVTESNKSKIIGVVIAKTNPRVTDTQLPSDCIHGIAVALGQATSSLKWWSNTPTGEPYNMYKYTTSDYNTKGYGDPRGVHQPSFGTYSATEAGKKPSGYNNTEILRHLLSIHGLSSAIIDAVDGYSVQRPNGTSTWYLPSVYEMTQIYQCYKNNGLDSLLTAAGGAALSSWDYWTVSEVVGNENSYAGTVNPVTGAIKTKQKTSSSSLPNLRYVIAF